MLTYVPAVMVGGRISRRTGGRQLAIILGASAACYGLVPVTDSLALRLALIVAGRFVLMMSEATMNVIVNDNCSQDDKKAAFSMLYLAMNVGFATGPLVAGFLFKTHTDLIFTIDAAGTALVSLLAWRYFEQTRPAVEEPRGKSESYRGLLQTHRYLMLFAAGMILFHFTYAQIEFGLPVFLESEFVSNGSVFLGYLMTVNATSVLVLTPPITRLTRNVPPFSCILLAGLFYAVGFGSYYFATGLLMAIASTIVWSLGESLFYTNMNVFLAHRYGDADYGMTSSLVNGVARIGMYVSPAAMGLLTRVIDVRQLWIVVGGLMLFNTAWLVTMRRRIESSGRVSAEPAVDFA